MNQKVIEIAGFDKGKRTGKEEVAKEMLKQNIKIEFIISYTGLTKEEIEKLS